MKASTIFFSAIISGIAYWVYGNGRGLFNIMTLPPLPASYYFGGDVSTRCVNIQDKILNRLKFCEDATVWHALSRPKLLISCDPGRKEWNTVMGPLDNPEPQGDVWLYDFKHSLDRAQRLVLEGYPLNADFHPLGIHTVPSNEASVPSTAFIINHGRHNTTIEIFHLYDSSSLSPYPRLIYVRTLSHPAFVSPNAIAPISPTSFYVSNDHRFTRRIPLVGGLLALFETFSASPLSWVDRVDLESVESGPITVTRAISNIKFANGIAISPNGDEFALASTLGLAVHLYERKFDEVTKGENLTYKTSIPMPFSPDNLSYDESEASDNTLIVAGHPHFPSFDNVVKKKAPVAPSWVVAVKPVTVQTSKANDSAAPYSAHRRIPVTDSHTVTTLYQSDGSHYSTSATGVKHGNDFFVVGLYGEGVLYCN